MASLSLPDRNGDACVPNTSTFHTPQASLRSASRLNDPTQGPASLPMSRLKADSGVTTSRQADARMHTPTVGADMRLQEESWFGFSPSPIVVNGTKNPHGPVLGTDRTSATDAARDLSCLAPLDSHHHDACHNGALGGTKRPEMSSGLVNGHRNVAVPHHSDSCQPDATEQAERKNGKPPAHSPAPLGSATRESSEMEQRRKLRGSRVTNTPSPPTPPHTSLYKIDESAASNGHRYSHVSLDHLSDRLPYRVTSRVEDFQTHWWVTLLRALRQRGGGREGVRSLALLIVMDTVYSLCEMAVGLLMGKIGE